MNIEYKNNCEYNSINMIKNLVSIIMPAYNSSKYIGEAIESVRSQSISNWELIIIDDCSSDDTYSIAKKYSDLDTRIKVIRQEKNLGVVKSRNYGLKIANGEFVAFLDSDDKWNKYKLEKQLNIMKDNNYAFTFTAYEYITEESEKTGKIVYVPIYQNYDNALKNTIIGCLTVVINRGKTGEFYMPELEHGEDLFTWLEIMKRGFNAYGINECLAEYRISNNSLSSNKVKALKQQWNNYRNIEKISLAKCILYFTCYVFNAVIKRI